MKSFFYKALNTDGSIVTGELDAESQSFALKTLEGRMLQVISIDDFYNPKMAGGSSLMGKVHLSVKELISLTEDISDLLESGLQVEPALTIIASRKKKTNITRVSSKIKEKLKEGVPLSEALRQSSDSFDALYINIVRTGEESGNLGIVLKRKLDQLILIQDVKQQVKGALIYPIMLAGIATVLLTLFMYFAIPQLAIMFKDSRMEMPFLTQKLISFSSFLATQYKTIILSLVGIVTGIYFFFTTESGTSIWHRIILRIPLVGKLIMTKFHIEFSQTMGLLLESRIPLFVGLKMYVKTIQNRTIKARILKSLHSLEQGTLFSKSLETSRLFPDDFLNSLKIGEQTGKLGDSLSRMSVRFNKVFKLNIKLFMNLIEPVIIVITAILVGLIVFSMISAMLKAISSMNAT